MRTTVTLDDELIAAAIEYAGVKEKSAVIEIALKAYLAREAARRLARLGGSDPTAWAAPRRRPPDYLNPDPSVGEPHEVADPA